jgi:3-hydroxy acid dehydrogenase/malonic semialdehyde reductase
MKSVENCDVARITMTKTILITGATSGIGCAIAKRFALAGGYRLIVTGRREEKLCELKDSLKVPLTTLGFDIRDREAVENALSTLPPEFSKIDILVNNAGLALGLNTAQQCDLNDWQTMVDINIKGLLTMTHALLPRMVSQNQGHIINIGSTAATYPYTGGNVYGATKAFVHQFAKNLRADLLGTNVRVTTVAPGLVQTDFFTVRFKGDSARAAKLFEGIKPLSADDIAETVFWCANQPAHVNINLVELMPSCQAATAISIHRNM